MLKRLLTVALALVLVAGVSGLALADDVENSAEITGEGSENHATIQQYDVPCCGQNKAWIEQDSDTNTADVYQEILDGPGYALNEVTHIWQHGGGGNNFAEVDQLAPCCDLWAENKVGLIEQGGCQNSAIVYQEVLTCCYTGTAWNHVGQIHQGGESGEVEVLQKAPCCKGMAENFVDEIMQGYGLNNFVRVEQHISNCNGNNALNEVDLIRQEGDDNVTRVTQKAPCCDEMATNLVKKIRQLGNGNSAEVDQDITKCGSAALNEVDLILQIGNDNEAYVIQKAECCGDTPTNVAEEIVQIGDGNVANVNQTAYCGCGVCGGGCDNWAKISRADGCDGANYNTDTIIQVCGTS